MYRILIFLIASCNLTQGTQEPEPYYPLAGRLGGRPLPDKGEYKIETLVEFFKAKQDIVITQYNAIAYGITERIWSTLWVPLFLKNNIENGISRGVSDIFLGTAYTYFLDKPNRAHGQIALKMPSGNPNKYPPTGTGTYDIFLQHTTIHSSSEWFFSADIEGFIRLKNKKHKPGNTLDIELIAGHAFSPIRNCTVYTSGDLFMLYNQGGDSGTLFDIDTGGTAIFLGPLISVLYKSLTLEFAFQLPIGQNLFGNQPSIDFLTFFVCVLRF